MKPYPTLRDALISLNSQYGVGSIIQWGLFLNGKGFITVKPFGCNPREFKFKLINQNTIEFRKHRARFVQSV